MACRRSAVQSRSGPPNFLQVGSILISGITGYSLIILQKGPGIPAFFILQFLPKHKRLTAGKTRRHREHGPIPSSKALRMGPSKLTALKESLDGSQETRKKAIEVKLLCFFQCLHILRFQRLHALRASVISNYKGKINK